MTEPQEPRSAAPEHPTPEELSEYAYSPETAAARLREHTAGCAACTAEVGELRLLLAALAELPEPELPAEVGIRLDAALARAWQQAEDEQRAAAAPAGPPRRERRLWSRIAMPVSALGLLVLAGVGLGYVLSHGGGTSSSAASGSAAQNSGNDAALSQWVRSVLPSADAATSGGPGVGPQLQTARPKASTKGVHSPSCASYPQRTGYTVLTTAASRFEGEQATLIVYANDAGPASSTVFAVVYAGPCPTASSRILDQGVVSR